MQAAKIKPGETYAMDRRGDLVRFVVQAIHTEKTRSKSLSQIEGYIEEDRKEGEPVPVRKVDPDRLIGPYAEQQALVERKAQEQAARDAVHKEKLRLGDIDRRMLYAFVGVAVPKVKPDEYRQLFRVGYQGGVDFSDEGDKAIIEKVRALQADNPVVEHGPRLVANDKD